MMKQLLFCFSLLLVTVTGMAQDSFTCRAQRYIAQYSGYAIAEQKRCGVPASITLAQGVLETEAGRSELVAKGNNHFGIKCKNGYCGPKMYHDDDKPGEAFIVYNCAEESYKDHSDYLKRNKRYEQLFTYTTTDYKSWAKGLKRCGYATNPIYAERLIKLIEDFNLQEYTLKAMVVDTTPQTFATHVPLNADTVKAPVKSSVPKPQPTRVVIAAEPVALAGALASDTVKKAAQPTPEVTKVADTIKTVAEPAPSTAQAVPNPDSLRIAKSLNTEPFQIADTKFDSGKVIVVNGLKAFYANKGEMLLQYAVKYNIRYPRLLEINELPDAPLTANTLIYLEKKRSEGTHAKHTVKEGETIYMIAQQEGILLKRLLALNMLDPNDEPAIGTILELQNGASHKPSLRATPPVDLKNSHNLSFVPPTPADEYVAVTHAPPVDTAKPVKKEVNRDTYVTTIHTAIDSTVKVETVPVKPVPPEPVKTEVHDSVATAVVNAIDTPKDELASLKAQLDKVVYPTDNRQVKNNQPVKSEPIILSPTGEERPIKQKKTREPKPVAAVTSSPYYTVKKGDNLSNIAQRNHTTVEEILAVNKIDADALHLGQKLRMPGSGNQEPEEVMTPVVKKTKEAEPKETASTYTVKKGDNLYTIAQRNHTTVDKILALNKIEADDLHLGQKLRLPGANTSDDEDEKKPTPTAKKNTEKNSSNYYTVKKGDNLSSIAQKNHVTIKQLLKLNDIDADDLSLGQKLRIK